MEQLKNVLAQTTGQVLAMCEQLQKRNETLEKYLFGNPELWCVKLQVAGHMMAMRSREAADLHAAEIEKASAGFEVATVVPSPWPADIHREKVLDNLDSLVNISGARIQDLSHYLNVLRKLLAARGAPIPDESES